MSSSLDDIKRKLTDKSPGSKTKGDIEWYRFPKGTDEVKIRLLPPWAGAELPVKVHVKHYKLPDMDKSVPCMRTWDLECDVCEVLREYDGRLEAIEQWAGAVTASANMLIKKDKTQQIHAAKVHVGSCSRGLLNWIIDAWEQEGGPQALTDPYEGRDLIVKREKFNGKFDVKPAFSSTAIADSQDEVESILAGIVNLDKVFKEPDDDVTVLVRDAAQKLRDNIENRLLTMTGGEEEAGVSGHDPDEPLPTFTEEDNQHVQEGVEVESETEVEEEVQAAPVRRPAPTAQAKPTTQKPGVKAAPVAAPKASVPAKVQPKAQAAPSGKPGVGATRPPTAGTKAGTTLAGKPQAAGVSTKSTPAAGKPTVQPKAAPVAPKAAPKSGKMNADTPTDAPECFADASVHDEDSEVCLECPHEYACQERIAASAH